MGKETMKMNCKQSPRRSGNRSLAVGVLVLIATVALAMVGSASAVAEDPPFEIVEFSGAVTNEDGTTSDQAGSHPYELINTTQFPASETDPFSPLGAERNIHVDLPPGLIGNPEALGARCTAAELIAERPALVERPLCPSSSQVGTLDVGFAGLGTNTISLGSYPIFNMVATRGRPALLATNILGVNPVYLEPSVRSESDYGISIDSRDIPQPPAIFFPVRQVATLWGVPGDPSHDDERCLEGSFVDTSRSCPVDMPQTPFFTLPTDCSQGSKWALTAESWEYPGDIEHASFDHYVDGSSVDVSGCDRIPFDPTTENQPRTKDAESATGLDFELRVPDDGLLNPDGISQAHVKKSVVTLPEGVTLNPSAAEGLGACSAADYAREKLDTLPGQGCPNSAKLGTLSIETPLLKETVPGNLYIAEQDNPRTTQPGAENPFDSLLALYMVARLPERGLMAKAAGKIEADPRTGQLIATFDDLPRLPFSKFELHFREGSRAPLVTPPTCGTFTTRADFVPWSAADPDNPQPSEIAHTSSSFVIDKGPGGGPCPSAGVPPFEPGFSAGSLNNSAGSHTAFTMRVTRKDGDQDMTKFSAVLPPGVLGKLAGVDKCPDSAIPLAQSKTGREEIASPSCPAGSEIGRSQVGAGVGSVLTYVPGKIYLGGPFKGDPLSVIAITPVVAGPFDVGTVVVREALTLNPKTAEVEVDGAASDPIPHILAGIPAKLRDLRVYVDRPDFILNPTSCDPSEVGSTLFGGYLDVFSSADDIPVSLSDRFQAASCRSLGFKPKLNLNLKGGTKRGGHPGLKALYAPRPGDANLRDLVVRLPRSAFLDQAHIRTICTRVQFAADACPKGAQYGYIKAWTPLLEEPLQGPVWLRSSNHKLPDLVFDLHGLVDVEVATRIDSANGGIRASIEDAPDAPLSKVELRMQGAKKGLIVNSRNLCGVISRASVQFEGHNGKEANTKPVMRADCGGKRKHPR